ncbi:hypothetical protein [Sinorhizobium glycinis]|uniref:hypothetical protein n=1 Tax=Sinorhizobium glycinis TaxID=1472378 RepID=UPI0012E7D72F|nr:hypothetical protein [Sinorhizobium glycinis]
MIAIDHAAVLVKSAIPREPLSDLPISSPAWFNARLRHTVMRLAMSVADYAATFLSIPPELRRRNRRRSHDA